MMFRATIVFSKCLMVASHVCHSDLSKLFYCGMIFNGNSCDTYGAHRIMMLNCIEKLWFELDTGQKDMKALGKKETPRKSLN